MLNPSYRSNQRPFFGIISIQKLRAMTSASRWKRWKNPTEGLKFFFSFLVIVPLKTDLINESSLAKLQVGHSYPKGQIWSNDYWSLGENKKVFCLDKISLMKKSPLVKGKIEFTMKLMWYAQSKLYVKPKTFFWSNMSSEAKGYDFGKKMKKVKKPNWGFKIFFFIFSDYALKKYLYRWIMPS